MTPGKEFGQALRVLRQESQYPDLGAFAEQADLHKEGIRKIENGERLPARENLDRILSVASAPSEITASLRKQRDILQAKRDGIDAPLYASEERIAGLSDKVLRTVVRFLKECDLELPRAEKSILTTRIIRTIKEEIGQ